MKQKNRNSAAEGAGVRKAKEAGIVEANGLELVNPEKELVKQEKQGLVKHKKWEKSKQEKKKEVLSEKQHCW